MVSKVYLADLSYLLYKYHYMLSNLSTTVDGQEVSTGALYGTLKYLMKLLDEDMQCNLFICEEGYSKHKKEIYGEYKKDRNIVSFSQVRDDLKNIMLSIPNVFVAQNKEHEADDVIGTLCHQIKSDIPKIILSKDGDFHQLFHLGNITMTPKQGVDITSKEVEQKYGVPLKQVLMFRVLRGDTSDKIPGAIKLSTKPAKQAYAQAMAEFLTIPELLHNIQKIPYFLDLKKDLERNYALMKLTDRCELDISYLSVSSNQALNIFEKYKLKSLIPIYGKIMNKFKENEWLISQKISVL